MIHWQVCASSWGNGSNGTKNSAKVFSFVDSSDSSRVKSDRGYQHRGVLPELATRAAADRPVKDRKHPLYRCSDRTYLGNRLSHQAGLSIREIAGASGLSSKLFDFDRQAVHNMLAT
jgi:hypothetical protein